MYEEDQLVDKLLEIKLDTSLEARVQETVKRNLLMDDIENAGCSHALIIDSDEFYTKLSFIQALNEIDKNNWEQTYCRYINYYTLKSYLVYPFKDGMYVPFVTRSNWRFEYNTREFPLPSDPTRRYLRKQGDRLVEYYAFPWNVIKMHHLSWCRADIRKKLDNWSSKKCFQDYDDLIDQAVDTYNKFDDNNPEDQRVKLLFNTPKHEVIVRHLPKQYIFPKYDYKARLRKAAEKCKILFLVMSTEESDGLFNDIEKVSRETWVQDIQKYEGCAYYKVTSTDKDSYIDSERQIIYIHKEDKIDDIYQMLDRFLSACDLIPDFSSYTHIVRLNASTWVNVPLLHQFLSLEHDSSKIYSFMFGTAFWSLHTLYGLGQLICMSHRHIEIIKKQLDLTRKQIPDISNMAYDDILIYAMIRDYYKKLGIDYTQYMVSLNGKMLPGDIERTEQELKTFNFDTLAIQVKTFTNDNNIIVRKNNDPLKMKMVHDCYKAKHISIKDIDYNMRHPLINVIPYAKTEWINDLSDTDKVNVRFNICPLTDEILETMKQKNKN